MGCKSSAFDDETRKPEFAAMMQQFQAMQLSRSQIKTMFKIFHTQKANQHQRVSLTALLEYMHIENTPFTEKAFLMLDESNSGSIDFRGFVLCLWNYCTLTRGTFGERTVQTL
jgi:Ca2+-binding EF-hand superfamily protein